jgi:hypothetical protein
MAKESFVLFHPDGAPGLFDAITGMCNDAGFSRSASVRRIEEMM